jgi:hypothetical protein
VTAGNLASEHTIRCEGRIISRRSLKAMHRMTVDNQEAPLHKVRPMVMSAYSFAGRLTYQITSRGIVHFRVHD